MKDVIIVSVSNLKYRSDEKYSINDYFLKPNDSPEIIDNLLSDKRTWGMWGTVFKLKLSEMPYFIRRKDFLNDADFQAQCDLVIPTIGGLMNFLWFAKDNSCNVDEVRVLWNKGTRTNFIQITETNRNAKGLIEDTTFSFQEMQYAMNIWGKFIEINSEKPLVDVNAVKKHKNVPTTKPENKNSPTRLERAIGFVFNARATERLAKKIAFYVMALECLFVIDKSGEIAHKLSERAAFYLGKTDQEKLSLFTDLKTYYNLRSSYVHGQAISETNEKLQDMSIKIDDIVRRIFKNVILRDSEIFLLKDNKKFSTLLNGLAFNQPFDLSIFKEEKPSTTAS